MTTLGLIGFGYWGPNYARILSRLQEVRLKWICDMNEDLLKIAQTDFPKINVSTNYLEVLKDKTVDAVVIATPVTTHAALVKSALEYGKHVLVEKPLTTSSKLAEQLFATASRHKLRLFVGHTYLFHPAVIKLKSLLKKQLLGKPLFFICQRTNFGPIRKDVNVLWDLASHDISTLLFLTGSEVVSISASGTNYIDPDIADLANINLIFANGTFASILVSWLAPVKVRQVTVVGEQKMAVFDDTSISKSLQVVDKAAITFKPGQPVDFINFKKNFAYVSKRQVIRMEKREPLGMQIKAFIKSLQKPNSFFVSSRHVCDVIKVLEKADQALLSGKTVEMRV